MDLENVFINFSYQLNVQTGVQYAVFWRQNANEIPRSFHQ